MEAGIFKRRLRHRLLSEIKAPSRGGPRLALAVSAACSLILAGLLTALVIEPSYAQEIHNIFAGEQVHSEAFPNKEKEYDMDLVLNPMLVDQSLVRTWAEQKFIDQPAMVQPVKHMTTFTINSFRLQNGKMVDVLTRFPEKAPVRKRVY